MSEIRMCDNCGEIFSVNEKGWKQYTESITALESNAFNHGAKTMHMGPCCVLEKNDFIKPRVRSITSGE